MIYKYCKGFTLIELVIVIFIISLFFSLVMPTLFGKFQKRENVEIDKLAATIRYIKDTAMNYRKKLFIKFNLKKKLIIYKTLEGEKSFKLKKAFSIKILSKGEIKDAEITIFFDSLGYPEPFYIYFNNDKCIVYNPFNSMVRIKSGNACKN